jgi:hypothetical protein
MTLVAELMKSVSKFSNRKPLSSSYGEPYWWTSVIFKNSSAIQQSDLHSLMFAAAYRQNRDVVIQPEPHWRRSDENYVRCVRQYAGPTIVLNDIVEATSVGESVTLDASRSYDADGGIATYTWKNLTTDTVLGNTSVVTTSSFVGGNNTIQVEVTDTDGVTAKQSFQVFVETLEIVGEFVVVKGTGSLKALATSDTESPPVC